MKTWLITFFAGLWRFMIQIWSVIILGLIVGVAGNILYTVVTTGGQTFPDWHKVTFLSFLISRWYLAAILFLVLLLLMRFAYLAHRRLQRQADEQQQQREKMPYEALAVAVAQGTHILEKLTSNATDGQSPLPSILHSPTSSDTWPLVWNIPYRRNAFFTGREKLLKRLYERFKDAKAVALTQTLAIHGLGGIGKTQTAVEYAYRYRQEYQAVLWVRAAARDTMISDYATIATLLHLIEKDEHDQARSVEALKYWLGSQKDWLLILDNADDLEILPDFLPSGEKGHLLLTTRDPAVEGMAQSLEIEQMDMQEGIELLLHRARGLTSEAPFEEISQEDQTMAAQVAKEMGGLPLALDQAGAYIAQTRCGLARYLELYRQHRADLLKWKRRVPSDYPKTVATTWALAFEQVEHLHPVAADLLRLCAFLDPDSIAEDLFTQGALELDATLRSVVEDPFVFNETIDVLRSFALIRRFVDTKSLALHRLVQLVLKDRLDTPTQLQWAEQTVRLVHAAFPEVAFETWEQCKRYLSQVFACLDLITLHDIQSVDASLLLYRAASYLNAQGRNAEAEPLLQRALVIDEKTRGPEHPSTSATLDNLAQLYHAQGRNTEAEPLLQRALAINEKTLGPEHPDTSITLNNLAQLYKAQGRYTEAEPLLQRALAIKEKTLGPEHPSTSATLNNLAQLYQDQGHYTEAEPLLQRALAINEKTLGPEHPSTSATLNNLALLYYAQGHYTEAEPLLQRALAINEKTLGPEHPDTSATLDNLAQLYQNQGHYTEAEPLLQRALAIKEKTLGPEHPDTSITLNNLALLYYAQGHYTEAEPLLQRALAIKEKTLGPEHPSTATILENYASLLRQTNRGKQAAQLLARTQAIRAKQT